MKGFALDESGDVIIENGVVQMVHDAELTLQTIRSVLGTKKGEWFANLDEGVGYDNILGKKRYASQNNPLTNQYIKEISKLQEASTQNKKDEQALNDRLARRLDGES